MTTWYVRPDTSHSEIRNGTSHATAWGGWSSIVWGGTGVAAGDTLYVCGAHSFTTSISVGNHGASDSSRVTISGGYAPDPGSMIFASGVVFLQISRNYTTVTDLTITASTSNCVYLYGAAITGVTIRRNTFYGGTGQPIVAISGGNGLSFADLTIDDNDFIGGSGSTAGSAISWLVVALGAPVSSLTRIKISNNRFEGCSSARAVISLRTEDSANVASKMADVIVTGNIFTDCYAVALEIFSHSLYGRNTGIRILDNVIRNQKPMGILGGGMSIAGFAASLTESFGPNIIARNEGYIIRGPCGLINLFYGSYVVYDNYGEDVSTHTIDGNGLLFDHGCDNCLAYGNRFKRLTGNPGVNNSGVGIMVLDATNCRVYGNIVDGCKSGVYFGNKAPAQSSDIHNNTFLNCSLTGVDILSSANKSTNFVRNNIFTSTNSAIAPTRVVAGAWTGESNNVFHGFGPASGHTLDATDITADPLVDLNYRPQNSAVVRRGKYLGGKDHYGKHFYDPPNIGGVDDVSATPRYLLMRP